MRKKFDKVTVRNFAILFLFPVFLAFLAEYVRMASFVQSTTFIVQRPSVLLFDIIVLGLLFWGILFLVHSVWISMAVNGLTVFLLACVEYYKFRISGSHLVVPDLFMTTNVGDIAKFANIELNIHLITAMVLLAVVVVLCRILKITFQLQMNRRIISFVLCAACLFMVVSPTQISANIYRLFGLDTQTAANSFLLNQKFNRNGFLGFLVQNTSETLASRVKEPEGYSQQAVHSMISSEAESVTAPFDKPSVIFIMSESFADLRGLNSKEISNDAYTVFDSVTKKGYVATCVVPTFGGYTARTEFELLFGLPCYALNTPPIPHKLIKNKQDQETIVRYYRKLGYQTTYIHPFSATFYNRDKIYPSYGFDKLFFMENLTVPMKKFRRYTDDATVMEQIKKILLEKDKPNFIFATTMQNHQPYSNEEAAAQSNELGYYLEGITNSAKSLSDFISWLEHYPNKVVVVFMGDHFPFFTPQSHTYENLGVNSANIEKLYRQECFVYNNFGKDYNLLPKQEFSAFYLPYVILDYIGAPKNGFLQTVYTYFKETPVYSQATQSEKNKVLDVITYDRIIGNRYSGMN